jgi:hypothetical protein
LIGEQLIVGGAIRSRKLPIGNDELTSGTFDDDDDDDDDDDCAEELE